jgi:hypothetical protein
MKSITWMKLNFVNDDQNIDEVDNMDDEKYRMDEIDQMMIFQNMDEIDQMMIFQNMDEITFLNQNCHSYVNVYECETYIFISLQTLPLSY